MKQKEITPKIYTRRQVQPGGNFTVEIPMKLKAFVLRAILEWSEELEEFLKKEDYELVLRKKK